jgi:hypothetical protein
MNLFNEYYKTLLNEMPKWRVKSRMSGIQQSGIKRAKLTDKDAIKKAKSKDKTILASLSNSILSGNDDVEKATRLFFQIDGLPDQEIIKARKKVEDLIQATNSPYHSFDQIKDYNILQFRYYNNKKIKEDLSNGKLTNNVARQLIQNVDTWHGLYVNIALLLTKMDILQNPGQFGITLQDFYNMDDVSKRNFIKPKSVKYFKALAKTHISTDSEVSRSKIASRDSRDKTVIFFFGNVKVEDEDAPNGFRIETEPFRSSVTMDPIECQKYSTLKEKEDNVKFKTPPFQKGGGTMQGKKTPPPVGFKYGDRQFIGKTVSEVKQMVNHDEAFKAFKEKYPPTDEKLRFRLYRNMGMGY